MIGEVNFGPLVGGLLAEVGVKKDPGAPSIPRARSVKRVKHKTTHKP